MNEIQFASCSCPILAGCATTPIPASSAKAVPAERLLSFQEDTKGKGTIVATIDVGHIGSGCYNGFVINSKLAARFAVGETATFNVPPGELLLRSRTDPYGRGLCGLGKDHLRIDCERGANHNLIRLELDKPGTLYKEKSFLGLLTVSCAVPSRSAIFKFSRACLKMGSVKRG